MNTKLWNVKNLLQNWKSFPKQKKVQVVILVCAIGVLLFASMAPKGEPNIANTKAETEEYVAQTEERITEIVQSIEGVGSVKVMVTVENGVEYVYAKEERETTDTADADRTSQSYQANYLVVEDSAGKRQALIRKKIEPTIRGVVIVCDGGDQPTVEARVLYAVTTALGIDTTKVCVSKRGRH